MIDKLYNFIFNESIKSKQLKRNDCLSFKFIEGLFNANHHPEAIKLLKTSSDLKKEFNYYWDNDREDDTITKRGFFTFFDDVCQSVEKIEDFKLILKSFKLEL